MIAPDEKHLNAGQPCLHMQRDHISFRNALRVDPLRGLHLGHRFDAVAQGAGALKLHIIGRGLHVLRQLGLNMS